MLYIRAGNQNVDYENVPQCVKDETEKILNMFYEEENEEVTNVDTNKSAIEGQIHCYK